MKPKRIILVRHGQSEANVDKSVQEHKPDYAVELSPRGRQQAITAGKRLKEIVGSEPAQFYASPYWRTRQTYIGICRSLQTARYYEDPRLREQEWGTELAAKQQDLDYRRDTYGHFYYRIPGGESCADVYDRVSDFMNTMFRDFERPDFPQNAIIVNHGMTIRVFLMRMLHWTIEEFEIMANPHNCDYFILELNDKGKYELKTPMRKYEKYNHEYQFNWQYHNESFQREPY